MKELKKISKDRDREPDRERRRKGGRGKLR